ncbi:hypothetical protein [Rhizobium leguminosarum]|uniref:hypothetical protein n=1 Tax=Rhizobium TaxID=379 RepID=UPI001C963DAA|nr:hypothetical protein [Rhizobium leguminosarum]MBY5391024.1 hypothetical protein [Rhizobium leguminosarum]
MAEQFEIAAWRHVRVAEALHSLHEHDDAGYHCGVAGENALKALLQKAGLESHWVGLGVNLRNTPMRGHFPTLHALVQGVRAEIASSAHGRYASAISGIVLDPSFAVRFSGWHIDIRYADTMYTPVSGAVCAQWLEDAHDLVLAI